MFYASYKNERVGKVARTGWALGTSLLALGTSQAWAQADTNGVTQLQQLVVTAAGFEQNVKDAPASITVITREELEKGSFKDLTDALKEAQGVMVTGAANENDILIRGLPGNYTLVLVDGKRQNTRSSRPNGSSGLEQSFIPPISAIERIEIVRGPMSSLYGSDAMGGVINIITRKVSDVWSGSLSIDGTLNEHSRYGNSGQTSIYISGPVVDDTVGIQIWGRGFLRGEDSVIGGTQGRREGDINAKLTITPSDDHEIYLEGGFARVRSLSHVGETVDPAGRSPADSYRDYDRGHWSATHIGHWGWTTSEISLSQEFGKRTSYSSTPGLDAWVENTRIPQIRNTVLDAKFTTPFSLLGEHTLVTGGQYMNEALKDTGHTDDYVDLSVNSFALFAEDEWKITDDFALTGGLRLNHHQRYGTHVTPRLYGVWNAFEGITVKGGVSTGFTAPELRTVTPGYYYPTQQGAGVIPGNPDLKPEESTSYEIGVLYDNYGGFTAGATYFYTDFTNKITNENTHLIIDPETGAISDPGGNCSSAVLTGTEKCLWRHFNIDGAVIQGVELTASWEATPDLRFRGTYTYTKSRQTSGEFEGEPLTRTPEHQASLRADWTATDQLDLWASVNYYGEQISANARQTPRVKTLPAYTLVDAGVNYALSDNVTLKGAVYNLFDKTVDPDEYSNSLDGRRFWVGMTSTF